MSQPRRVLATGLAGFIGRHCLPHLLARQFDVHAIARGRKPAWVSDAVVWHEMDLLRSDRVAACVKEIEATHLLHLAWITDHGSFWHHPDNYRWVGASLALLTAFAEAGGVRAVLAGSCAEYDWRAGFLSEAVTPCLPTTPFGICRKATWELAWSYAGTRALSVAVGRIFFVFGPYEKPDRLVASVIQSLLQGRTAHCSHGRQIRDFMYAPEVARAFVHVLEQNLTGVVNIASGEPVRIKDIIDDISAELGCAHLVRLGQRSIPTDEPPLLVADVRRLFQEAGFLPQYDLKSALRETIRHYQSMGDT